MKFQDITSIYCIGIGGAGLSGLARLAHAHGKTVAGSDLHTSTTVQDLIAEGITVHVPQSAKNVPLDYDWYVYSSAVPADHPERKVLTDHGFEDRIMNYFQAVGKVMQLFEERIAVSGTHGKTTTTAMLATVLIEAKFDPTAIVGSTIKNIQSNVRVGKSLQYCVVEACEYQGHMLELHPSAIILTNIEADHLDYYQDLEHIVATFQKYINQLPSTGVLVKNTDDSECKDLGFDGTLVTYGIEQPADIMATNIEKHGQQQTFTVKGFQYTLAIPGDFNVYNALAVIAYALHLGIAPEVIQRGLKKFKGTARRFERIGTYKGAQVISDYAHHPTALRSVIKATREAYPQKRVVIVFQPHQHNRTEKLFNDFVVALHDADLIIVEKIYDVAGREANQKFNTPSSISSENIVQNIESTGKLALYADSHDKTKQLLAEHVESSDVVLIVGAGDINILATELCSQT